VTEARVAVIMGEAATATAVGKIIVIIIMKILSFFF
jgi:hypothetical protein